MQFTNEQEAITLANDSEYGLEGKTREGPGVLQIFTASFAYVLVNVHDSPLFHLLLFYSGAVISKDSECCRRVVENLDCGIAWCASPLSLPENGYGWELSVWGLQNYLQEKQVRGKRDI
eukprot:667850-Pelagomonas_calceolata.AAC.1